MTGRPHIVRCEGCDTAIAQKPIGARRRFCDTCRATRKRAGSKAWKRANPEAVTRQQRERRQRRRYDTTTRRTA